MFPSLAFAQEQGSQLDDAEIIIEKSSDLVLPQVQKPMDKMVKKKRVEETKPQVYELKLLPISLQPLAVEQQAYTITPEISSFNADGGRAEVGLGFPLATKADIFYQQYLNENVQVGGQFLHNGLYQGPVEGSLSSGNRNSIGAFGNIYFGNDLLKVNTSYNQRTVHFYGLSDEELANVNKDDIKQSYNHFDFSASYELNSAKDEWQVIPSIDLFSLSDQYNSEELYMNLGLYGGYKLSKDSKVVGGVDFNINNFKNESWDRNKGYVRASLAFEKESKQLSYHIGGRIVYDMDTLSQVRTFNIYPDISAKYQLNEQVFFDGKIEGDLNEINLRTVSNFNPFIHNNVNVINENKVLQAEIGTNFSPWQHSNFRLGLGYGLFKNMGFYLNNPDSQNTFDILYSDENTGVTYITIGLNSKLQKDLVASADFKYNSYAVGEDIGEAWHRPEFEGNFQLQYKGIKNFTLATGAYLYTGIKAKDIDQSTVTLDPIFDLFLRTDYQLNEQLAAYIQLNNITGQKYEYFYNYEQLGFNVMLGASINF